jgi:hypothetical protein
MAPRTSKRQSKLLLEKTKCAVPTQYASGYALDLYCDHDNPRHPWNWFPHQFTGETFAHCAKVARRVGWIIHTKTRTATCPKCSGRGKWAAED